MQNSTKLYGDIKSAEQCKLHISTQNYTAHEKLWPLPMTAS